MSVSVFPARMCVYHMCVWCSLRLEDGVRSLVTGAVNGLNCHAGVKSQSQVLCLSGSCS